MKIAIAGATGRMGRMLIEAVLNTPDVQLAGALEHSTCPQLGEDAGSFLGKKTGVIISSDVAQVLANAEFLIDFTRPEGTMAHLAVAEKTGTKMIIGTTGLNAEQIASLKKASTKYALTWGVTYRNLQDRNLDVAGITTTPAPLRYPSLSAGYDLDIDSAATPGRTTRAQVELTLGIPVLGQRSVLCFEGATSPRDQFAC